MTAAKMNAIVATGYGSSDVLEFTQVETPEINENEVLVKVVCASATRADSMMLTGKPYFARLFTGLQKPKNPIPGTGFAGTVEQVGSEVTRFKAGDAVFGETTLGFSTNAEFVSIPEDGVILHKPDLLPYNEACALCDGALTSLNFLKEVAQIKPGQKVLINGASGSLGTAAVQLARYFGAEVTGVCSTANVGLVKSLGAQHVIDYTQVDFTKSETSYDIIYDTVGKSSYRKCKQILAKDGQYISPVLSFPLLLQMLLISPFRARKAKFAATGLKKDHELRALTEELLDIVREGKIQTQIERQFPLEKAADAFRHIASGRKKGNVVIMVTA
jgi:NADPH:quinone reductase-like Zn-dependent oxidoreductase